MSFSLGESSWTSVQGEFSRIVSRIALPSLSERCKKAPPKAMSRNYVDSSLRPRQKYCRRIGLGIPRSGLDEQRSIKRAHATLRDYFSFCLEVRTSLRILPTQGMGKKVKQNLARRTSHSPCALSTVRVYHNLANPIKENGNSFHLRVSCDMPKM